MPIYTRTGDKGETSLFGGKRVSKSSLRVEAYGSVDELNSMIGLVLSSRYQVLSIKKELIKIQNDLLEIGSQLANSSSAKNALLAQSLKQRVLEFEDIIDTLTEQLPTLRNFILPGGGKGGSLLHVSRTVSRRAERRIVELQEKEKVNEGIIMYMNRLSDLLFTMARYVNYKEKKKETIWSSYAKATEDKNKRFG